MDAPLAVHSYRSRGKWFTPTHVNFAPHPHDGVAPPTAAWQSRKARKGRYPLAASTLHNGGLKAYVRKLEKTSTAEHVLSAESQQGLARIHHHGKRMRARLYPDVSFWIAVVFTFGSMLWVVNGKPLFFPRNSEGPADGAGFLVWFPVLRPYLETKAFTNTAAATAFIGGTVFLVGSYLMVVEALDRYVHILYRKGPADASVGERYSSGLPSETFCITSEILNW
jgi:hypothetical protein